MAQYVPWILKKCKQLVFLLPWVETPKFCAIRCPDCSCEVTGNLSACPSSQPSALSWCSFRAAVYLDVIGVCEKHRDAVDAHAPAARGGQPVLQGSAEGFIYEHGLVVASGLGLEDRATHTVTLFQAARSGI